MEQTKDAGRDAEKRVTGESRAPAAPLTSGIPAYGTTGDASDGFVFLGLMLTYLVLAVLVGLAVCLGTFVVVALFGWCFGRGNARGIFNCNMVVSVVAAVLCWGYYLLDELADRRQRRNIGRGLLALSREIMRRIVGMALSQRL